MTAPRWFAVALLVAFGASEPDAGGQRPGDATATTTAVLVDVVVRDRQGRPVTDLTAADFELREDGVPQRVGSFTRVARGAGIGIQVGLRDSSAPTIVGSPSTDGERSTPDAPPGPM